MRSKRYGYSHKLTGVGIIVSALCLGFLAFGESRDTAQATGPSDYDLSWFTVDGGGAMRSTGGDFELSGTIGQPDAGGPMVGSPESGYEVTGGFWFEIAPGDCNSDGGVNLFDHDAFLSCIEGPAGGPLATECVCFDLDGNGTVDMRDFRWFQRRFSGS